MVSHHFRAKVSVFVLILCSLTCRSIDCQKRSQRKASEQTPAPTTEMPIANQKFAPVLVNGDGLLISNRDASSKVLIHGYLQADGRFFLANLKNSRQAVLLFRRVRPLVEGTLANRMDFRFMPDFGEGKSVIQEVYVEWKSVPYAKLRVGKFKAPLGLEVLRSDRDLTFVERSMASDLIPLRNLGAQLGGSLKENAVAYAIGIFNGAEDGANSTFEWRNSKKGVVRVFFEPWAASHLAPLQPLGIGVAASVGYNSDALPSYKTVGQNTFFRYSSAATADGQHKRLAPQATYFFGPLGVLAEYVTSGQTASVGGARSYLSNHGWQLAGSIMLTGEKNTYDSIRPSRPLAAAMDRQHCGAWELAIRHSALGVDPNAFPRYAATASSAQSASESAIGINWHLNQHTKLMIDFESTGFHMATDSVPRLHAEHVVMTEIQLAL